MNLRPSGYEPDELPTAPPRDIGLRIYYIKKNLYVNSLCKSDNNIFGGCMKDKEIFSLSLDIGQGIITSGGEVQRAEDTIKRINRAYGQKCTVLAIPSLIIAQSGKNIQIRRIENEDINLAELSCLNSLSRKMCNELDNEINITKNKIYSKQLQLICIAIATGSFSMFFGGNIIDALIAALIGIIITFSGYKRISLAAFSSNLIDSFIAAIIANAAAQFIPNTHSDKIIIGTIMLLVPGLTVVNAMRDMMSNDLIAGMIELFNAVISALGIAFGTAGAILLFTVI